MNILMNRDVILIKKGVKIVEFSGIFLFVQRSAHSAVILIETPIDILSIFIQMICI